MSYLKIHAIVSPGVTAETNKEGPEDNFGQVRIVICLSN